MPLSAAALTCPGSPSFPCLDATPRTRRRGRRRDPSSAMAAPRLHLATAQSPSLTARPCQAHRRRREKQEEEKDALPCGLDSLVKRRREGRRNGPLVPRRPKKPPAKKKKRRRRGDGPPVPRRPSPRAALPSRSPSQPAKPSPEPAVLLSHQAKPDGPPSRLNLFERIYTPFPFFFFF